MKTRLLMLLSVFMAITSVGWMQAQSITYYKTGSGSGGTGSRTYTFTESHKTANN